MKIESVCVSLSLSLKKKEKKKKFQDMNPIVITVHLVLMPKHIVYLLKLEEARK